MNNFGYVNRYRVSPCTGGTCGTVCRPGKRCCYSSTEGVGPGAVPGFSLLYTKFPYRDFDITKEQLKFSSVQKALVFRIAQVLTREQPPFVFLRGIPNLLSRSRNEAIRAVFTSLIRVKCGVR